MDKWERLKKYLDDYELMYRHIDGRYCIALSIDDLRKVMREIEEKYGEKGGYGR